MRRWLKWARKAGRGASNVPFRHSCRCGQAVDVLRTDQHQRLTCSACGDVAFLMPRDVYPGSGPVPGPPAARADLSARDDPDSRPGNGSREIAADVPSRARASTGRSGRARPAGKSLRKAATNPSSTPADTSPVVSEPAVSESSAPRPPAEPLVTRTGIQAEPVHAPRRRLLTPFRLVGVCMLLIVGTTAWWGMQRARLASDAGRLNDVTRTGMESLAAGDFVSAARDLGLASDVLRRLGRDDPAARLIRQRGREARAAGGLVSASLIEILEVADRCVRERGSSDWDRQFDLEFQGRWIIMQSPLEVPIEDPRGQEASGDSLADGRDGGEDPAAVAEDGERASGPGAFWVEYPFAVGAREVRLVGQLPDLARLPSWPGAGDDASPVIFAAQLESCRLDPRTDIWQLRLETGSVFLWTDLGSLRHLGFLSDVLNSDAKIQAILDTQAGAVGLVVEQARAIRGDPETRPGPAAAGDAKPGRESAE